MSKKIINSGNYVEHVLRTDAPLTPELLSRLQEPQTVRLLHAAMGMVTEAAELTDMLKKHIFYGTFLDMVNAAEEVGDNQWYVGLAIDVMLTTMDDILTMNIEKLRLRYPEKFSETDATERDLCAERRLLEHQSIMSERGADWINFAREVHEHIEEYTVSQYGDKGEDQATDYTVQDHLKQVQKYIARFGKNSRLGQQRLDFFKAAHYIQMALTAYEK